MKGLKYFVGICFIISPQMTFSQPSYYNSKQYQTNEYSQLSAATQRAYAVPNSPYTSSTPSASSSGNNSSSYSPPVGGAVSITPATGPGSSTYSNIGGDDRRRRQQQAGQQNEERYKANMAALSVAETKYRELIANHGNAKTAADHYDLLLQGMRAGIDLNAIFRVIGSDLSAYHAKWGNKPDLPYISSQKRNYDTYVLNTIAEARKIMDADKTPTTRFAMLYEIAKVQPSVPNKLAAGQAAMAVHNYDKAYEMFLTSLYQDPKNLIALSGWGDALMMMEDAKKAEENYAKALLLEGNNAELLLKTAWACFVQNKLEDTYELTRQAATLVPMEAGPYLALAALHPKGEQRGELLKSASLAENNIRLGSLTEMLVAYSKILQANGATDISGFYLDLAVHNDPKNIDLIEFRYGTNIKLNRQKAAAADQKLLEQL